MVSQTGGLPLGRVVRALEGGMLAAERHDGLDIAGLCGANGVACIHRFPLAPTGSGSGVPTH